MEHTATPTIKKKYIVLREETIEELEGAVSYHISKDWIPLGGVAIEPEYESDNKIFYIQAVWKL